MSSLIASVLIIAFIIGLISFLFISTSSKRRIRSKKLYGKKEMEKRKW
jgi:hypothetical protein